MLEADTIRQLTETLKAYGEFFAVAFLVFGTVVAGLIGFWVKSKAALNKAHAELAATQKETAVAQTQSVKDLPTQLTAGMDSIAAKMVDTFSPIIQRQDGTITELNRRIDAVEKDKQNFQTQIDAQCVLIQKQNEKIDALQQSLTQKDTELETAKRTIAEQTRQLEELAALKVQVNELTAEVGRLKAQLSMQEKLQIDLAAAQETIRAKDALIADLTKERDELKAQRDALALRVANQGQTITDLTAPILAAGSDARADDPPETTPLKPPEVVA